MDIKIDTKIKITFGDKEIELSEAQGRQVFEKLKELYQPGVNYPSSLDWQDNTPIEPYCYCLDRVK
jgi:hypothetical protein